MVIDLDSRHAAIECVCGASAPCLVRSDVYRADRASTYIGGDATLLAASSMRSHTAVGWEASEAWLAAGPPGDGEGLDPPATAT